MGGAVPFFQAASGALGLFSAVSNLFQDDPEVPEAPALPPPPEAIIKAPEQDTTAEQEISDATDRARALRRRQSLLTRPRVTNVNQGQSSLLGS